MVLTFENLNPNAKSMNFLLPKLDQQYDIDAYSCDLHAIGLTPMTYIRQVLACISHPDLLKSPEFPDDVQNRAREFIESCDGQSIGKPIGECV